MNAGQHLFLHVCEYQGHKVLITFDRAVVPQAQDAIKHGQGWAVEFEAVQDVLPVPVKLIAELINHL